MTQIQNTKNGRFGSWLWNIVFLLYLIYFLQGVAFPEGGFISAGVLMLIILLGLYNLIKTFVYSRPIPTPLIWVTALFILFALSWIVSPKVLYGYVIGESTNSYNLLKQASLFFLSIFTGYQIGVANKLTQRQIYFGTLIFLLLALYNYLKTAVIKYGLGTLDSESGTNNAAYNFIFVIPFLPLIANKYKKSFILFCLVIISFVLMGAKRGAIITAGVSIVYALYWYNRNYKISVKGIAAIAISLLVVGFVAIKNFQSNEYLADRLDQTKQGYSSGRDYLYGRLWGDWVDEPNLGIQLFGSGMGQTINKAGNYAHNDWLELLIDNGLIGGILYAGIFISLIMFMKKHSRTPKILVLSVNMWLLSWFMRSWFSMGYLSILGGLNMMLLGVEIAMVIRDNGGRFHKVLGR